MVTGLQVEANKAQYQSGLHAAQQHLLYHHPRSRVAEHMIVEAYTKCIEAVH